MCGSHNPTIVQIPASHEENGMNPKGSRKRKEPESFDIEEIRLISDLRIMHSKIDELYGIVQNLKRRHSEGSIVEYADPSVLPENISRVDEIYLWFVKVKEEMERRNGELD